MKSYAGGRLFDAKTSPFGVALTPVQCLHYALTRPGVASDMVGFSTPDHVAAALAYETASPEELDYASVLAGAPRHAYYGQCTYCGHCAPCPQGIDIAMVNKYYDLAVIRDEVPDSLRQHYLALDVLADECIACQNCEERCPFGVKIAEKMEKSCSAFCAGRIEDRQGYTRHFLFKKRGVSRICSMKKLAGRITKKPKPEKATHRVAYILLCKGEVPV